MKQYLSRQFKSVIVIASLVQAGSALFAQDPGSTSNPPLVVVVAPDPAALEGTSSGAFTLIRYGPTDSDLSVDVQLSGSASNGVDYATIPGTITIPAGSLATDVKVDPIVNTVNRGNKTVVLSLETNSNYSLGTHRRAEVKIVDDIFDLLPPTLTISSPLDNSSFTNPPSIKVVADVNDPDSIIKSVSFYANDRFLGHIDKAPFSMVWTNPPWGKFAIFGRALDQFGRSSLSAPVHISVINIDPVVKLTNPTNGANFVVHQDIPLSADASDPNEASDSIASVSFYANSHLLGTVTTAPYNLVWSNAPSGFFALRAVATDQQGDKGYSKAVYVNVSPFPRKMTHKISK